MSNGSEFRHLLTSEKGISWSFSQDGDQTHIKAEQDLTAYFEQNKAMRNHNDGWSDTKELRRVASIPDIIALHWLHTEGWWYQDKEAAGKLREKLNSSDWSYLRTADGRV